MSDTEQSTDQHSTIDQASDVDQLIVDINVNTSLKDRAVTVTERIDHGMADHDAYTRTEDVSEPSDPWLNARAAVDN